ncbi:hypothetical protein ECO7815_13832 [Escherichia coli O55:H7 str. 3256-97]|nr:hypothetical protein ECO7815_13832 [Escherichia coli O55:H7 str. 3256-97]
MLDEATGKLVVWDGQKAGSAVRHTGTAA